MVSAQGTLVPRLVLSLGTRVPWAETTVFFGSQKLGSGWPKKNSGFSSRNSCPKTCFKSSCEIHPVPWKSKKLKSSCRWLIRRFVNRIGGSPKKIRIRFWSESFTWPGRFFFRCWLGGGVQETRFARPVYCKAIKSMGWCFLNASKAEKTRARYHGYLWWYSSYLPWRFLWISNNRHIHANKMLSKTVPLHNSGKKTHPISPLQTVNLSRTALLQHLLRFHMGRL